MTLEDFIANAHQDGLRVALVAAFTGNIIAPDLGHTQPALLAQCGQLPLTADDRIDTDRGLLAGCRLVRHDGQLDHDYQHQQPFKPAA